MRYFFFLLYLVLPSVAFSQSPKIVKLKATGGNISINSYHITKVVDDRQDTTNIGIMRAGLRNKQVPVNLVNGAADAITHFISTFVNQSENNQGIELHIQQLAISEKTSGLKEQADLTAGFGFFKNGKKLTEYNGTSYIQTGMDASPYIGKLVSQSIESVLKDFDSWWTKNKHLFDEVQNDKLKVTVVLDTIAYDDDLIAYSQQPLTISDFAAEPDGMTKALAITYSGFALRSQTQNENGVSSAVINLFPYFDKTKSWMKKDGKNEYVLAHEQLHFDITALKCFELLAFLKQHTFNLKSFQEDVAALQKKFLKETEQLQAQYDKETQHGMLKAKQKEWEQKIKEELKMKAISG
jgi:hypothetical protein